ncbi:MAG: cytochrome b/b6 domain-containing protein [Synechocystis sp.]
MTPSAPYQSVLLRLIHGAIAVSTLLAIGTGFWVYNTYDQRWGSIPLPEVIEIQGIHGTIALTLFLLFPVFAFL